MKTKSSWSTHHIRINGKGYNLRFETQMKKRYVCYYTEQNGHSLNLLLSTFSSKVSTNNDTTSRRRAQNSRKLPHGDED